MLRVDARDGARDRLVRRTAHRQGRRCCPSLRPVRPPEAVARGRAGGTVSAVRARGRDGRRSGWRGSTTSTAVAAGQCRCAELVRVRCGRLTFCSGPGFSGMCQPPAASGKCAARRRHGTRCRFGSVLDPAWIRLGSGWRHLPEGEPGCSGWCSRPQSGLGCRPLSGIGLHMQKNRWPGLVAHVRGCSDRSRRCAAGHALPLGGRRQRADAGPAGLRDRPRGVHRPAGAGRVGRLSPVGCGHDAADLRVPPPADP